MTTKSETLSGIQARIEELQSTITEKEEQIKTRAMNLKDDLKAEFSPDEIVKKYPLQAVGMTFVTGMLIARTLKGLKSPSSTAKPEHASSLSQNNSALYNIGIDILRSAKDMGFKYLQRYIDSKLK
ncbi:MAG: hypothetical protein NT163_02570 [Chlorobiales bacterium]|nr:hypothetical protein [Chlorobiales bacterium]